MSDTPRTDAEEVRFNHVDAFDDRRTIPADFARQLERELAEANQRIRELTEWRPMESAPRGGNLLAKDVLGAVHTVSPAVTPGLWIDCKSGRAFIPGSLVAWLPLPKGDA